MSYPAQNNDSGSAGSPTSKYNEHGLLRNRYAPPAEEIVAGADIDEMSTSFKRENGRSKYSTPGDKFTGSIADGSIHGNSDTTGRLAARGGGTDGHGTPYQSTLSEFKRTDHENILKDRVTEASSGPVSTLGKAWNQYVSGKTTKGLDPDNATSVSYSQREGGRARPE